MKWTLTVALAVGVRAVARWATLRIVGCTLLNAQMYQLGACGEVGGQHGHAGRRCRMPPRRGRSPRTPPGSSCTPAWWWWWWWWWWLLSHQGRTHCGISARKD